MDDTTLHPIGELARRTGVPVRTIRFYSDTGVVVPAGRSPAGYRLYGLRQWMAGQFEPGVPDPRVERYWRLVWCVNGWRTVSGLVPVYPWLVRALRAHRTA